MDAAGGVAALAVTIFASAMLAVSLYHSASDAILMGREAAAVEIVAFALVVSLLIYGNWVYQLSRHAHYRRQARHRPPSRDDIEKAYDRAAPSLLILVPSYKEERHVIWQTLLSAALLEYPNRRVTLLIDDPPAPTATRDREALAAARKLPFKLRGMLREPAARFHMAYGRFLERKLAGALDPLQERALLAGLYGEAAAWLEAQAERYRHARASDGYDHTDALFVEKVLLAPARDHRARARELQSTTPSTARLMREFRRIATLFDVEVTSFERKRYDNLSHAPNKAMNLNSYMALVGGNFREVCAGACLRLEPCGPAHATLQIPDAAYIITLDADSLLLSDYALRLVHVMEAPGNERVAVAQTPYSAVPGAPSPLERVAGATTDIQHIAHQGSTSYDAAYWVGANALLRRAALEDIAVETEERGHRVRCFIQDKTVIEDTGSTVDLVARGWRVYNYPARLAYSATPADFGALVIQRRRWANGGLLILPALLRYLARQPLRRMGEAFLRTHYLVSPTIGSVAFLILLLYPFSDATASVWLPVASAPYYLLYGADLAASGYGWTDMPRVYALNLLLVPVNLGGVLLSLRQGLFGRKSAFGRTPKTADRTSTPPAYLLAQFALAAYCVAITLFDVVDQRLAHAVFAAVTGTLAIYGIFRFIGFRDAVGDLAAESRWLRKFTPPWRVAATSWEPTLSGVKDERRTRAP